MTRALSEPPAQPGTADYRREDFTRERIDQYRALVAQSGSPMAIQSHEEREANRRAFLDAHPAGHDLWVFGYGSLMWNPAIHVAESRPARIVGYQRAFCLTMAFNRGSADCPGLMLCLEAGEGAQGVAFRIAAAQVDSETEILWMREMLSGAYRPIRHPILLDTGTVDGLTFVANPGHPRIETGLDRRTQAQRIARAKGVRGTNREYLYQTKSALDAYGLTDAYITALERDVRAMAYEAA